MSSLILTAAAAACLSALCRSPERFAQLPENILLTISCWSKITFNIWQGSKNMWKICLLKLQLESCSATFCFGLLLPIRLPTNLSIYLSLYNTNTTRIFFIPPSSLLLYLHFFWFFDYSNFKRQTPKKRRRRFYYRFNFRWNFARIARRATKKSLLLRAFAKAGENAILGS